MPTEREQDILRMIEENPLISQQELADRLGITRSSAAVHISNLMKKGLVKGKGYILQHSAYITVVGGATMDIGGRPSAPMVPRDSNPGTVRFSPGGVGRNIAHNLALMGEDVRFLSVFGDDQNGASLVDSCRKVGIDTTGSPVLPGGTSAVYLFIASHTGEMELAVSDMEIYERITPEFLAARMDTINRAAACVIDTNPPVEAIRYLAENCTVPIFVDPVSTTKAKKLTGLLDRLHTLKCNRVEAALLSGVDITDDASLEKAARALLDAGIVRVVITLSEDGCLCAEGDAMFRLPRYPGPMANSTGAGDAFTAALAHGTMRGLSLEDSARLGLAAASLAIASPDTISPDISAERLSAITGVTN